MVAEKADVLHRGLVLVGEAARLVADRDPFRADGHQGVGANGQVADVGRFDLASVHLHGAHPSVDGEDASREQVVLADETGDESPLRLFVEHFRRRHLLDAARLENGHSVGHGHGLLLVVGDVNHRNAELPLDAADFILKLLPQPPVQGAEWLIHQHQFRLEDQGAGDGDALLLASGKLAGPPVPEAFHAHQRQCPLHPLLALRRGHAPHLQGKGQIAAHRHVREQGVVLEHDADAALVRRQAADGRAVDANLAGAGRFEPSQHH